MKLSAIIVAGSIAFSGIALAEPITSAGNGVAGHYGDLDPNAVAGQDALAERVRAAVQRACRTSRVQTIAERRACQENTRAEAMARANSEARAALTAADARKSGGARVLKPACCR